MVSMAPMISTPGVPCSTTINASDSCGGASGVGAAEHAHQLGACVVPAGAVADELLGAVDHPGVAVAQREGLRAELRVEGVIVCAAGYLGERRRGQPRLVIGEAGKVSAPSSAPGCRGG